jgi:hypothetical protein
MEVSGQFHAPGQFTFEEGNLAQIGQEAEWAPEPVWTLANRENLL